MTIKSGDVQFGGESGYLAQPEGGSKAGVVLLTTIYGVNRIIRGYADMLAGEGFVALIWNYDGGPGLDDMKNPKPALERAHKLDDGCVKRMSKCVDHLLNEIKVTSVATLGFCLGGRYCLMLAADDPRISGSVSYHPTIHEPMPANESVDVIARAADIPSPVLVLYPGQDRITKPDTFFRLQASLQTRKTAPTVIHFLPDADHGFLHHTDSPTNVAAGKFTRPQVLGFLRATAQKN
jgi:carboxymethylenebutenolidase